MENKNKRERKPSSLFTTLTSVVLTFSKPSLFSLQTLLLSLLSI